MDEDERDLRRIPGQQDRDEQGAEGGRWHVAEEIDERFKEFREKVENAAEDSDRDSDDAGPQEAHENHLQGTLVAVKHGQLSVGHHGGEIPQAGPDHFIRRGQIDRVRRPALRDEFQKGLVRKFRVGKLG